MNNKTLLQPIRVTTAQRDAITLGVTDTAQVFNTDTNDYERWDGTQWLGHPNVTALWPAFSVTGTGTAGVADQVFTLVPFNITTFDVTGSVTGGVFTCPAGQDGFYQFDASVELEAGATAGESFVTISLNNAQTLRGPLATDNTPGDISYGGMSITYQLAAGETVRVLVFRIGVGTRNVDMAASHFSGIRIR